MRLSTLPIFATVLAGLLPVLSQAQAPALLSTTPARNSLNGSRTAPVQFTFSRAVAFPEPIRVHTDQRRGVRAGTFSGAGTAQVSFQPTQPFAPGERVSMTVPASVSSPAQVVEFRAATGRGAATFSAPYTIPPGGISQPEVSVAGDFDHDGDLDLLTKTSIGGKVFLNNGSGQFTVQAPTVALANRALSLRLADVNGDGNLDVISYSTYTVSTGVSLNLGTGLGTFLAPTQISMGGSMAVAGDFNADGMADVVVGELGGSGMTLRFLPGNSSGVLASVSTSLATLPGRDLGVADMDEDGDLDIVVVTGSDIGVYLNNGAGVFTLSQSTGVNFTYGGLSVGDFNGDGHADAVCSSFTSANVSLVLGTGTGGLLPAQAVSALSRTQTVNSGDMDGDGDLDLIVTNDRGITQTLLNNSQGQFSAASAILIGLEAFTMANTADLNGDGSLDIYTGHGVSSPVQHGIDVFFNQPPTVTHTATPRLVLDFVTVPNPAHEQIALALPPNSGLVTIELRDALGRLVKALPAQLAPATGAMVISLTGLAPGRYAVWARTAAGRGMQWVEVQ